MAAFYAVYPPSGGSILPPNAATASNQVLEIADLDAIKISTASIDSKLTSPVAVTGPLTDTELRATPVPVSGTIVVSNPGLTDTELRASPVPVSGTISTGGLTDVELRASAVPVSLASTTITGSVVVTGPLTDAELRATAVPISGTITVSNPGLTDTELRATPVPVSGTIATGGLTDTELRASAVPVSLASTTITGTVTTATLVSGTATLSNVAASATSVSLLASNASRKNATFFNDSTATLYLKFGATASTTSYTVQLTSNAYYELPNGSTYTGVIDGIWSSATGAVRITELT